MSWDRMRYILWDNNCSVPPRIHMTPFTAAAAAAELPASSGKERAQANGEPPQPGPRPSSFAPSPAPSSATTAPAPPRLPKAQSAPLRAARRSASGGEGPAERAAPRPPRPPGPALRPRAAALPPLLRGRTAWPSGFRFSVRPFSLLVRSSARKRDSRLALRPPVH